VRDTGVQRRVVAEVADALLASGGEPRGVVDSGLPGPKGNREFVLHLAHRERAERPVELDRWIVDAVG
jgi:predicted rRNA methylase YqxC with S4 and FtsJ domains